MTPTVITAVEVANLALDMVKEATITSMEENRAAARWMNRNFVPVRNYSLNTQIWKFAMKRAELAADPEPPAFEWKHRYRKPNDCFRVLPPRHNGSMDGRLIPHQVEGDFILTNEPAPLRVRYIRVVDNPAEWPAHFVDAVVTRLALGIAHTLTGKTSMIEILSTKHSQAMAMAASLDAAEGTHASQYATAYDDARYYHMGGGY